jgi:hypothetical protein
MPKRAEGRGKVGRVAVAQRQRNGADVEGTFREQAAGFLHPLFAQEVEDGHSGTMLEGARQPPRIGAHRRRQGIEAQRLVELVHHEAARCLEQHHVEGTGAALWHRTDGRLGDRWQVHMHG